MKKCVMKKTSTRNKFAPTYRNLARLGVLLAAGIIFVFVYKSSLFKKSEPLVYKSKNLLAAEGATLESDSTKKGTPAVPPFAAEPLPPVKKHLLTPNPLKGVYMTSWVAGTHDMRDHVVKLINETEMNALVVDVKDYTGKIAFLAQNPELKKIGADENRIRDIRGFVQDLHDKDIYVIARVAVFQDPYFVKIHPELAVQSKASGAAWKDDKGLTWIDVCAREYWNYTALVAQEAADAGFDEINFDYIRFPSDGAIEDMVFTQCPKRESKPNSLEGFFTYLQNKTKNLGVPISADLFGLTTVAEVGNDLNIGQVIERAAPHFDYISPMVYPSHYPPGFDGYKNPAVHPYEIISSAMEKAIKKLEAVGINKNKLRPWLQDFDLGADYNADMIKKEKKAVYDSGLSSWLMWDPRNEYTRGAYGVE